MKYVVLSTAVMDELHFADGRRLENVAGGAGIYALAGMKVWADSVQIVTGVGIDYFPAYSEWYTANNLPTDGLLVKDNCTPRTIVRYFEDGERKEIPIFGLEHYQKIEVTPAQAEPFLGGAKGVYVFKNTAPDFWPQMLALKQKLGFTLMWEIAADATEPECLPTVEAIARHVDILSINRTEACNLLSVNSEEEAAEKLLGWNLPMVYLRVGERGAYAIGNGEITLVPSVPVAVADVTGGGNSSSGGALVGFCETRNCKTAAMMGNISASFCIAQHGVPPYFDAPLHAKANNLLKEWGMYNEK